MACTVAVKKVIREYYNRYFIYYNMYIDHSNY